MIFWIALFINIISPSCPIENGVVSSHYGWRKKPCKKCSRFHRGVDIAADKGEPIHATWPGVVSYSGRKAGYGKHIVIKHLGGYKSRYAHASEILAKKGEMVYEGEIIGKVGKSGVATGYHLHFSMSHNRKTINPEEMVYCPL
jgi:murein DD-endopeptidase MepM/ murein hydrolase activator NlpD